MAKTLAQGRKPGSGRKPGKGKTLREGRKPGSGRRRRQDIGGKDADITLQDQESRPISSRDMEAVDALRELTHSPSSHPAHNSAPVTAALPPSMDYTHQSLMDQQLQQQRVDVVPPKPFITHKILLSSTANSDGHMHSNPNGNHTLNHNANLNINNNINSNSNSNSNSNNNVNVNMNFTINGNNQDPSSSFLMGPYNYLQRPFTVKPYLDLSTSTASSNQPQPQPQATHITKNSESTEKNTTI
ncbi:Dat1p SKDI_13G0260 [Saccharomyces kudriavzevii IFO 1802]|uniref:Uncharacterized protein n=2 Tax=Saccharomyces kudriavzevii (strain ATCC MYA-4449 / AS 2.2408 / CBS 8840 / NBRC 1802 / NCYC 2889) TaxID=226230 RepID=A0AA35NJ84_SACK1|nr:uncharacterized protein SKDI_13G0260 [Saccharomyces kudriavzevii IFO 1802]EJT44593.1 DAT1-like protein [Saccharomyces kudriavzevii IFO 1802]CAI4047523.1 hypothetical protein SKDI_13G0260 [Saccharomyces kudriavzevii IFO 1802]